MALVVILFLTAMNLLEIDETVNDIQQGLGFRVQSVSLYDKTLVLKLWQNHVSYFLILSIRFGQQGAFLLQDLGRVKIKNEKKPLSLFANTHLKEAVFLDVSRDEEIGRQIEFHFTNSENEDLKIKLCLIPSALNISVHKGGKSVALNKPKDLPKAGAVNLENLKSRPLEDLKRPWLEEFSGQRRGVSQADTGTGSQKPRTEKLNATSSEPSKGTASALEIAIQKKRKAMSKVRQDLKAKTTSDFYDFATLLTIDSVAAKEKFPELYDEKVNKHKLKDKYFEKHKALASKRERVEERLRVLEKELLKLESLSEEDYLSEQTQKDRFKVDIKTPVKTRKLEVASDLVAYYGKSAIDNMKLLRSAKAWHYWFHIKDIPSSHMILLRDKTRNLTDDEIRRACQWFVAEISGSNTGSSDVVVEILMTECRFVKPIKGDKLGRVNYSHEQVFRLRL